MRREDKMVLDILFYYFSKIYYIIYRYSSFPETMHLLSLRAKTRLSGCSAPFLDRNCWN